MTPDQIAFLQLQRVGRLATVDASGQPFLVPVCYATDGAAIYIALDEKPKQVDPPRLRRVRNIQADSRVAFIVDQYDEDWSRLAFLHLRGVAALLSPDHQQHAAAIALLRTRYAQYNAMAIHTQPVITIMPRHVTFWQAGSVVALRNGSD